jgi:hypothetical protein
MWCQCLPAQQNVVSASAGPAECRASCVTAAGNWSVRSDGRSGEFDDPRVVNPLIRTLSDRTGGVSEAAMTALRKVHSGGALAFLVGYELAGDRERAREREAQP